MDFTAEQELLRESVRRTCQRHSGLDVVRKLENDPVGYSPTFWTALGELGLDEMTMLDAAIVYEEFGRALSPSPHFVSSVLAAGALRRAGDSPVDESGIVTVAWLEPDGGFAPEGIRTTATAAGNGWTVRGVKRHVAFAKAAQHLLVLARTDSGIGAFLVDSAAPGVAMEQQLTVAGDTQYRVALDDVPAALVAPDAWSLWHETMLEGAVLLAAQAIGGAHAALALAVDYAKKREQFDKPLAAFQSISHYLADATTALDGAETLVWQAAWAASEGRSIAKLAPMAKLFAGRTFRDITATAQQIFGGAGFTVDFDIQLYFRRAKAWQLNWWDDRHLEELVAAEVLDPTG